MVSVMRGMELEGGDDFFEGAEEFGEVGAGDEEDEEN
jgi:hypothetical protein